MGLTLPLLPLLLLLPPPSASSSPRIRSVLTCVRIKKIEMEKKLNRGKKGRKEYKKGRRIRGRLIWIWWHTLFLQSVVDCSFRFTDGGYGEREGGGKEGQ